MSWKHVYPTKDSIPHNMNYVECSCKPKIDWENHLIIHNSFDCRESIEQAEEIIREETEDEK